MKGIDGKVGEDLGGDDEGRIPVHTHTYAMRDNTNKIHKERERCGAPLQLCEHSLAVFGDCSHASMGPHSSLEQVLGLAASHDRDVRWDEREVVQRLHALALDVCRGWECGHGRVQAVQSTT